jgi:hypothetical protein
VRSTLYQYRFVPSGSEGVWVREPLGAYCPTLALEDGRLRRAEP